MNTAVRTSACLAALGCLSMALAAGDALGVATANGDFKINNSKVSGNATVFDGTVVETGEVPSRLNLNAGPRLELSPKSRAKVLRDRIVLESGMTDLAVAGDYGVEAGSLRIKLLDTGSAARVVRPNDREVQVAALKGSLRVFDSRGLEIANVFPGTALSFEPQEGGAAPPSSFLGCLLKRQESFILYDQTTRIIVELRGGFDFASEWGNRVQVNGATDTTARSEVAAQVVDVTSLTRYGEGGCGPVASAIGAELPGGVVPAQPAAQPAAGGAPTAAQPAPPAASSGGGGGMSAGTKVLIVGLAAGGGAAVLILTQKDDDRSRD